MLGKKRFREDELETAHRCISELRAMGIRQLVVLQSEQLDDASRYVMQALNDFEFSMLVEDPVVTIIEKEYTESDVRIAKANWKQILIVEDLPHLSNLIQELNAELQLAQITKEALRGGLLVHEVILNVFEFLANYRFGNADFLEHMIARYKEGLTHEKRCEIYWDHHCVWCGILNENCDRDENGCDSCVLRECENCSAKVERNELTDGWCRSCSESECHSCGGLLEDDHCEYCDGS